MATPAHHCFAYGHAQLWGELFSRERLLTTIIHQEADHVPLRFREMAEASAESLVGMVAVPH